MALKSLLHADRTSEILAQVPDVTVLYLRLGHRPQGGQVHQSGRPPPMSKRKRSPAATSSQKRRELATSTSIVETGPGSKIFQVQWTSEKDPGLSFGPSGDFAETLATVGAVLVDNSAPLGVICKKALSEPSSRVCVVFASPSEFSAKRFSSTLAFAYDLTGRDQFSEISQKIDFFRALPKPSCCVLQLDFARLLDRPGNDARFKESTRSVQSMIEEFLMQQVGAFVDLYSKSVPTLRSWPANRKADNIVSTLLDRLFKGGAQLAVCVHAFERVLERPTICSFWEPRGIHASILPIIKTLDDILFAPIAASFKEKGIVHKIVITGTYPNSYIGKTQLNHLRVDDRSDAWDSVSHRPEALPLHGYTRRTYQSVLTEFWEMLHYIPALADDFTVALNACPDKLWRTMSRTSLTLEPEVAPIDPDILVLTTAVLDQTRKDYSPPSTGKPAAVLTVEDLDTRVKLLKRYQVAFPVLFPLVVRNMPAWFTDLVKPSTDNSEYPFVEIPTQWKWTYATLETASRDDGTYLPAALLHSLGLLRVGVKNEKFVACVAGRHAKQTLVKIIDAVNEYNNKPLSRLARISVEAFTLRWLQGALLEGLKDKPPMENEAAFQDFALEFLQDFLQYNGQWRHQAQAEPWFRCGTEEKCYDRRGDIVMFLKLADGRWHVYVIELKFFEAQATAAATQTHIRESEPRRALPKTKSSLLYFEAALRYSASEGLLGDDCVFSERPVLPDFNPAAFVIRRGDLRAEYHDRKKNITAIKEAADTLSYAGRQVLRYVGGAVQGVGAELGADKPGIADVRFTRYEESENFIAVFIPIALLLISDVLLYGWEGKGNEKKPADFRPAVAGVYPWTKAPTVADIQRIRKDKEDSRKPVNA
ncbi:hypothetical protein EXIGLDRAFT_836470 [Exidia glandulosa HHB12029]|uniref:Uncharacterized protein n=1 Tax=Exidia glandulosa HHB12029 TaxID=1314781 RepID=A0A165HRL9_EXIGL|nr:hypothetical protein EXIGLDRAFT_836470 [Exidia glandulosa HHB12029]